MSDNFESVPIHPSLPEIRVGYTTTATEFSDNLPSWLIMPVQTHTTNVALVTSENLNDSFTDTDGLITSLQDIAIGVRTADCVPLMLYASDKRLFAAVHAGWKGSLNRITEVALKRMIDFGTDPRNIYARFGAAICCDCYEVDNSLADKFVMAGFRDCVDYHRDIRPHLDLLKVNTSQLVGIGVPPSHIIGSSSCTKHQMSAGGSPRFYSWRRTPGTADRNITFIYLDRSQV